MNGRAWRWLGVLVAAFVSATATATSAELALPAKPTQVAQSDGKSWTLFRGDSAQTGHSTARIADKLAVKWRFKAEGPIKATPVIAEGRAFVGSMEGHFYGIDLKTGQKVWSFNTKDGPLPKDARPNEKKFSDPIEASACYVDGKVFVGAQDGNLYCFDAAKGKMLWSFETGDKITAAPNWVKAPKGDATWILVGSNDNRFYAVDAASGKKIWEYETGNIINGAPAVSKGIAIFGGCDGLIHMVNVADGTKAGEVEIKDYIAASAALDGDEVYVGHHGNKFLRADLKEKKIVWQFGERDFPFMGAPALTKEFVVFGGQDKRIHCVKRADGKSVWQARTRGKVDSSPIIVGQRVLIGGDDGIFRMLNLKDGEEIWTFEIGPPITSSAAVIDGLVLIGADDGNVYAFGEP